MPSITWGETVADGARLPFTKIKFCGRTLLFRGRPGPRLMAALQEQEEASAAALDQAAAQLKAIHPIDPRD